MSEGSACLGPAPRVQLFPKLRHVFAAHHSRMGAHVSFLSAEGWLLWSVETTLTDAEAQRWADVYEAGVRAGREAKAAEVRAVLGAGPRLLIEEAA